MLDIFSCTNWLFMCLIWRKCLFSTWPCLSALLSPYHWVVRLLITFFKYQSLNRYMVYKYFLPFSVLFFLSLWSSLRKKLFRLWRYPVLSLLFPFVVCAFDACPRNHGLGSWKFTPVFSSKNLMVLALIYRSLTHFESSFLLWCEVGVSLHSFACDCSVVPRPICWVYASPIGLSWHPLKINSL